MKIRTRESGSKWDLDGKLGGSGAIQANRTEFDNNWAASRLSAALYPIWLHRSRDSRVTLRHISRVAELFGQLSIIGCLKSCSAPVATTATSPCRFAVTTPHQ